MKVPELRAVPALNKIEKLRLVVQGLLGRAAVVPLGTALVLLLRFKGGYTIENMARTRRRFRALSRRKRPIIVCANHLTFIDSLLLTWALGSMPFYFRHYRLFPWNIPARENYARRPSWRLITYLGKCIPIDRSGSREHTGEVLEKLKFLLRRGGCCMIFPEGTRSRSGRVDVEAAGYGVGKLLLDVPECRIVCAYLRGREQAAYSKFPKRGERFYLDIASRKPRLAKKGARGARAETRRIMETISGMERRYFAREDAPCVNCRSAMTS